MLATPAYAQAAGGAAGALTSFVPLILIFAIMYFLLIRPQQKKVKQHQAMVASLRRGDQVVTAGGLVGKVTRVKEGDNEIEVEIAPEVKVRVVRGTVSQVPLQDRAGGLTSPCCASISGSGSSSGGWSRSAWRWRCPTSSMGAWSRPTTRAPRSRRQA